MQLLLLLFMFSFHMNCVFRRIQLNGLYQRDPHSQRWQLHGVEKKIDLAFILAEVDWVVTSPCPTDPVALVRETNEVDAVWATKERDFESQKMPYHLEHRKWVTANKKCMVVIKNTIEPAIVGSIPECDTITEYLKRIKSQFTVSSKTYATQLIK